MVKKKTQALSLSFLFILVFPLLLVNNNTVPVLAAEEEEEDNFTVMPNYRWQNETATDSAVGEQLIGDQYEVYNQNNETSGSQKFEKSRQLNSRDFYYESRFQLDVGGNETEYFRDVLGDACDWEEEDDEGLGAGYGGGSGTTTYADGIAKFEVDTDTLKLLITKTADFNMEVWTGSKIRIKAINSNTASTIYMNLYDGTNYVVTNVYLTEDWQDIVFSPTGHWGIEEKAEYLQLWIDETSGDGKLDAGTIIYIDSWEITGSLDYATHVESEVEDTWDWEDSNEYFYDNLGNVSDFADGSLENWTIGYVGNIENDNGWLHFGHAVGGGTYRSINRTGLSITAADYSYICIEVNNTANSYDLTYVEIYDSDNNLLTNQSMDLEPDEIGLVSDQFTAGEGWSGTETDLSIWCRFNGSGSLEASINMVYLYDVSLGDKEGFTGYTNDNYAHTYVNPEGWLIGRKLSATVGHGAFRISGKSIPATNFDQLIFRMKSATATSIAVYDQQLHYFGTRSLTTEWQIFTVDLSIENEWTGTETGFAWRDAGTTLYNQFYMDYVLLEGHYAENEGFKFSLLNQDSEEGMYWQFTRDQDSDEYTVHVDMLDATGIALEYEQAFNYSRDVDGWLYLDVEWHLDKKKVKFVFEYENGSDIIKTRSITDLYATTGTGSLLLLEEGMPALCMNNSMGPLARSLVLIDYIDADWQLNKWLEPSASYTSTFVVPDWSGDQSGYFFQSGAFGASSIEDDMSQHSVYYQVDIDRLDAISFDFHAEVSELESFDFCMFEMELANVMPNGSLVGIAYIYLKLRQDAVSIKNSWIGYVYDGDWSTLEQDYHPAVESDYVDASMCLYLNPDSRVVFDYYVENDNGTNGGSMSSPAVLSKEFLLTFRYTIDTIDGADSDDIVRMKVSSFDVIRKDIFAGVIQAVADPIVNAFSIVLSPFLIAFDFIAGIIRSGFKFLVDIFSPILTLITGSLDAISATLSGLAADIATAVWAGIGDSLSFITDAIGGIAADIWSGIGDALDFVTDAIADIAADVWDAMGDALNFITTAIAAIASDIITALIAGLADITDALWPLLLSAAESIADIIFDIIEFVVVLLLGAVEIIVNLIAAIIFFIWDNFWVTVMGFAEAPDLIAIVEVGLGLGVELALGAPAFFVDCIELVFAWGMIAAVLMFAYNWLVPAFSKNPGEFLEKFVEIATKDVTYGIALLGTPIPIPFILVWMGLLSLYALGLIPSGF